MKRMATREELINAICDLMDGGNSDLNSIMAMTGLPVERCAELEELCNACIESKILGDSDVLIKDEP